MNFFPRTGVSSVIFCCFLSLSLSAGTYAQAPLETEPESQPQKKAAWENPDNNVDVATDLERVEAYLKTIDTLKADFVQIAPNQQVAGGTFFLERPGRLRFEYNPPVPMLVVSDGTVITMIDYDLRQVTRWPINDTPLRPLVQNNVIFGKDLKVLAIQRTDDEIQATVVDPDHHDDGIITLKFSREPFQLSGWRVEDSRGEQTVIVLSGLVTNLELDKQLWEFDDPRPKRRRLPGKR